MPEAPWTDTTRIGWGKHKGKQLKEIPASYLLWLFEQAWIKDYPGLHAYLKKNEDLLMQEKSEDTTFTSEDGFESYDDYKNYRGN
jgi:hypothetical protein